MIYGYIRVSTDKQTTDNQRFEILKYADEKKLHIDRWIEETVSSTRKLSQRKLHYRTDSLTDFRIDICSRLAHRIHPLNILYEEV